MRSSALGPPSERCVAPIMLKSDLPQTSVTSTHRHELKVQAEQSAILIF
jgi:hypothetical protein